MGIKRLETDFQTNFFFVKLIKKLLLNTHAKEFTKFLNTKKLRDINDLSKKSLPKISLTMF